MVTGIRSPVVATSGDERSLTGAESSPIDGRWIGDSTDPPPVAPGARRGRYRLACPSAVHAEAAPVASPEHPRTSLNSRRTSSSIAPESALSIPCHGPCRHGSSRPHPEALPPPRGLCPSRRERTSCDTQVPARLLGLRPRLAEALEQGRSGRRPVSAHRISRS